MKTKARSSPSTIKLTALLAAGLMFGAAQNAMAAGTVSGSSITNLAKLSYSVSGTPQDEICSSTAGNSTGNGGTTGTTCVSGTNGAISTSFVVDNKVNLTVAKTGDLTTVPGTTKQALAFTVTNNGNTAQRFALTAVTGAATITTMSNVAIYRDVNSNGAWDAGDTLYVDASTFGDVAADGVLKVLIVADTPVTATNGQTAIFDLQAQVVDAGTTTVTAQSAVANTAGVDVVWADVAGAVDAARDGKHSALATYTVGSSAISVAKTVTVLCDPFNGSSNPKNIPGAVVQYAITITNAATAGASATLSQVSDALSASLAFEPKLISGVGTVTPATTCTSAGGVQLSATTGFGAVSGTGTTTTTYAAPGLAAQATTAGATQAAGTVTINYGTLAGAAYGLVGGVLPANSFVTVYFNAIVQ